MTLEGEVEPLHPTASHLFYSVDRRTWTPAFELNPSEWIATNTGAVQVRSVTAFEGGHPVFNIEVESSGTYFVSPARILTHNVNPCAWWRGSLISEGVSTGEQLAAGRTPLHVHDDFLRAALGNNTKPRTFKLTDTIFGSRKYDAYEYATKTAFEVNTQPWSSVSAKKLREKLDQVTKDVILRGTNPEVERVIWIGTEPLPNDGASKPTPSGAFGGRHPVLGGSPMMLRVQEMRRAFLRHGFKPTRLDGETHDYDFSRLASSPDLFEIVKLMGASGGSHAMGSSIGISVVRGETTWKGITLIECMTPRGNEAGWFEPSSREDAKAWLEEVLSQAPALAAKMVAEQGPKLLADTAEARAAAGAYLRRGVLLERPLETSIAELQKRATDEQVNLAERLGANSSIVKLVEGGKEIYLAAVLSMVVFGDEVEGRATPFDFKAPVMDRPLVWRIQLLADRLLRHHGLSAKQSALEVLLVRVLGAHGGLQRRHRG